MKIILFIVSSFLCFQAQAANCYSGNGYNKIKDSESCYGKMSENEVCVNVISVGAKHQWIMATAETFGDPSLGDIGYGAQVQYLGQSKLGTYQGETYKLVYVRVLSKGETIVREGSAEVNTVGWILTDYGHYPYLSCN